jgi:hypothetical protein
MRGFRFAAIVWLIAITMLLAGYYYLLLPQTREKETLTAALECRHRKLAELEKWCMPGQREQMITSVNELQENEARVLFTASDLVMLDFRLQELAREAGLQQFKNHIVPRGVVVQSGDKAPCVQQRGYALSFTAPFLQVLRFVNRLETQEPVFFIDKLTIVRGQGPKAAPKVSMEIVVLYSDTRDDGGALAVFGAPVPQ